MDTEEIGEIYNTIILGIKDYFKQSSLQKAVVGLSGGIDSTVCAYLAVRALGNGNVIGILMPERGVTSRKNFDDALSVANLLKINHYIVQINDFIHFFKLLNNKIKIKHNIYAVANAKSRARMCILYYFANLNNALVMGTSTKSEIAIGYATKYGDSASDILPIGDLWKTEVADLGKFLKISKGIISKKPTAELIKGVDAEKELGAPYDIIDGILKLYIGKGFSSKEIIKKGFNKKTVKSIIERTRINEHKRRCTPIIRISYNARHK